MLETVFSRSSHHPHLLSSSSCSTSTPPPTPSSNPYYSSITSSSSSSSSSSSLSSSFSTSSSLSSPSTPPSTISTSTRPPMPPCSSSSSSFYVSGGGSREESSRELYSGDQQRSAALITAVVMPSQVHTPVSTQLLCSQPHCHGLVRPETVWSEPRETSRGQGSLLSSFSRTVHQHSSYHSSRRCSADQVLKIIELKQSSSPSAAYLVRGASHPQQKQQLLFRRSLRYYWVGVIKSVLCVIHSSFCILLLLYLHFLTLEYFEYSTVMPPWHLLLLNLLNFSDSPNANHFFSFFSHFAASMWTKEANRMPATCWTLPAGWAAPPAVSTCTTCPPAESPFSTVPTLSTRFRPSPPRGTPPLAAENRRWTSLPFFFVYFIQ